VEINKKPEFSKGSSRGSEHKSYLRIPILKRRDMDQPRFCYVLTTTGRDEFADMTYASVAFLRYAHPEAEIICLCDAASHRALEEARHPLLAVVDRAEPVETPDAPPGYRNRFVKTRMRQILEGDFVYFDSDTLVVDRINEMLSCPAPMAGMPNLTVTDDPSAVDSLGRAVFEMMGWQLPHRTYINGGVLLLRDCEPTRQFARLWHEKWLAWSRRGRDQPSLNSALAKYGYADQPSLNSALADSGIDYEVLGNRFNSQVNERPSIAREPAAVWHFNFGQSGFAGGNFPKSVLDEAIARFRAEGHLTPDVIRELRQWPYPWRTPTVLDRWYVRRFVVSKDNLAWDSASRYWLAGRRSQAVMKYLWWRLFERRWDNRIRRAIAEAEEMQQKAAISG
jgi:hypothetical protein